LINGFGGLNQEDISELNINYKVFGIMMPRYYAIFFNSYSREILKDKNIRLALTYASDKRKVIEKVFDNQAFLVDGPLILGMNGYAADVYPKENFSPEKAVYILEADGWQLNAEGIREKTFGKQLEQLQFDLVVPQIPFLVETANLIKEDWSKIGVKLNVSIRSPQELNDEVIKTRNYQMILFGNIFANSESPDLY